MAIDYLVTDTELSDIADAIRAKGGTSASISFPNGFTTAIAAIPTGITPTGTKQISISGAGTVTEDVTNYANAEITTPAGTAGTPTATKGVVSGNAVSVTPSVTNSAGWVASETKTGTAVSVSASELVSGTKSITANGNNIDVTNYAAVDVNVSGGGGTSAWTKIAEKEITTSTSTTSVQTVETWATGHPEIWTSEKFLYVRIRDKAGPRNGRFYSTENFYQNVVAKNGSGTSSNDVFHVLTAVKDNAFTRSPNAGTSSYGVYSSTINSNGDILISKRYNSSSSGQINATYVVEVYLLDPAGNIPPFGS